MKSHVQVAVIGGGVVGCSVLYHLTKLGWRDVVLIERDELTSGSTWHAAGGIHTLNGDPNVAALQKYTINLYKEIEEISGIPCGLHLTGGYVLAGTPERMDWLKMAVARGRYLGLDAEMVSIDEAVQRLPIIDKSQFIGAMWDPFEGHLDPSGTTNAYAKSAQIAGAEIYRHTRVESLTQRADGSWTVSTAKGEIHAEHVVNCGGLWAREVGRMVGLELPILAMEHQYLLTEDVPHLLAAEEYPGVLDFEGEIYLRQERKGFLLGTYEHTGEPWAPKTTPWNFTSELLPPNLDRIADNLEVGFRHFPKLADAGIKRIVNGPFTFAPDGNPLVGPVRGLRNFWVACGVMAGFSQGGGVGLTLATWMTEGDPGRDVWGMDVARFGDYATLAYTNAKVRENYGRRFRVTFPNEELPVARPLRTTPIHDQLQAAGAVFGVSYGLEYPLWFAPDGMEPVEQVTFRRSNAHEPVAAECHAVRTAVGLLDTSGYAKYEVSGPGAEAFLNYVLTNRMPDVGRIVLAPMLNRQGKLIGDFTVARLGADLFHVFGSGPAEQYHLRWWESQMPAQGVAIRALRTGLMGLSIAGPNARALLAELSGEDVSSAAFPFMSYRRMDLGMIPAHVGRISFTGDLGYEFWVSPDYHRALYLLLRDAGAKHGIRHVGMRALNSMRLEKSFGIWARDYRPIYGPFEAGLGRFVNFKKGDFIGREAAWAEKEHGPARKLVTLLVEDFGADVVGDEPVSIDGSTVGWVTSGGYAHWSGKSVALAYVPAELAQRNDVFDIEVMGAPRRATIATEPPFDPSGSRMRG